MAGFDTAGRVQNVATEAVSKFGTPYFWIRYFTPCPDTPLSVSSANANAECTAMWNSGGKHLGPITSPDQVRLAGTSADGIADASAFVNALTAAYYWVVSLDVPSDNEVYCWLDQEESTALSVAYWDGWATFVGSYDFGVSSAQVLYPCLYCSPCAPPPNCSTLKDAAFCAAIWTPQPQDCSSVSLTHPPTWHPDSCTGCGVAIDVPTELWQFAEPGSCGYTTNVDLDMGAPNFSIEDRCLVLVADPSTSADPAKP